MLDHYAQSAKTLTLVAIIVQAVFAALFAFYFIFVIGGIAVTSVNNGAPTFMVLPILFVMGSLFGIVGLLWIVLDYFLVYKRIAEENVKGATDTSLILGIIQLILGGVVSGILLIVAYTQLGNSANLREHQQQG